MNQTIKRLDATVLPVQQRPTARILQFGNGNFMRGFFGWYVDRLNDKGGNWGIVAVRSQGALEAEGINRQDGLYTVVSRGVAADGADLTETRLVRALLREISAQADWDAVLDLACRPEVCVVASNTTEAGIVYVSEPWPAQQTPASFPSRVTRLLWARWDTLGREQAPGMQFLPCELIERNGEVLREIVLKHARDWDLGSAFAQWVKTQCVFYNTLVDRIVPGYPTDEAEQWRARLGYDDLSLTATELYHLFVIEQRAGMPAPLLPLTTLDPESIFVVDDLTPYRSRKVAVLNGAHTAFCPLALLAGIPTVREAMNDLACRDYIQALLAREVLPALAQPRAELDAYVQAVLRRFANPHIQHRWHDISLNGMAKFRTRNLPSLRTVLANGGAAPLSLLSLAAWAWIYTGEAPGVAARDADAVLAAASALAHADSTVLAKGFLACPTLWGEAGGPLQAVDGLRQALDFLRAAPLTTARLRVYLDSLGV